MTRANLLRLPLSFVLVAAAYAQAPPGMAAFRTRCAGCHGTDGNGGEHAPTVYRAVAVNTDDQLLAIVRDGIPAKGMPGFKSLPEPELKSLVDAMKAMARRGRRGQPVRVSVTLTDGSKLDGFSLGSAATAREMQLRTDDQKVHLLRKADGDRYRRVTSQADWTSMHPMDGNRYSPLTQITPANAGNLHLKWVYAVPNSGRLQGTPQVYDGVMYVTDTNRVIALDAGSGARIWEYSRPFTEGLIGNARSRGNNRSVTIAGDRVFMQTDHAHLVALNRHTGQMLWDTEMADFRKNYNATGSLMAVEDLVVAGTAGGEEGVRGFLAAYDQKTGKEVWRFWTIPAKGEPGSETWDGIDIDFGGGPTWLTGSYDPEAKIVYWPTGNAGPDFNGDNRKGDNLYTCSILALDIRTGKLKWHFQATPHDEWDWDAVQPLVLVDTTWKGQPRKLLLQANRNGFLYVLDRLSGKMLLASPLVKKLTWAKGIAADGRPIMNPNSVPTPEGQLICPAVEGAANFFSTSWNPATKLFYVNTLERCAVYTKRVTPAWEAGKAYMGGGGRRDPNDKPQKFLRAFDIETGKVVWEIPQFGPGDTWTGTLTTAGGIVIYGDDAGALGAADAKTGKKLWSFPFTENLHTSPMTYQFDNKQHVGMIVGSVVYSFGLP
ncbi:MAG: PQQ-binding-like beta-propeller repeat protein [Bryobacterales bacterium]|nr:PQQ-binding-like beta-propeller repeat protein [Bryobacterales bacterium]